MGPRRKQAEERECGAHIVRRPGGDRLQRGRPAGILPLLKPQLSLESPHWGVQADDCPARSRPFHLILPLNFYSFRILSLGLWETLSFQLPVLFLRLHERAL